MTASTQPHQLAAAQPSRPSPDRSSLVMTVAHIARKKDVNVLEILTECCVADVDGGRPPSLFARAA